MADLIAVPLFAWRPLPPESGFVYLYGHVEYRRVMAMRQVRLDVLARSSCEVDAQHSRVEVGRPADLVFDHCHDHGWVRAVVCASCNVKLGQVDAARKLPGIVVVPGNTGFGRVLANCPGGIENICAWMRPKGPFTAALTPAAPAGMIIPRFVVGTSDKVHALLGDQTACGLKPGKTTRPATIQTRYCDVCARIIPASTWESDVRYRFGLGLILSDDGPDAA